MVWEERLQGVERSKPSIEEDDDGQGVGGVGTRDLETLLQLLEHLCSIPLRVKRMELGTSEWTLDFGCAVFRKEGGSLKTFGPVIRLSKIVE